MTDNNPIFICGYRRTGKDFLCKILTSTDYVPHNLWHVYAKPNHPNIDLNNLNNYQRNSFADQVKIYSHFVYDLPAISDDEKDIPMFIHKFNGKLISARDIYSEVTLTKIALDTNYWNKLAYNNMTKYPIFTDFRFISAYDYFNNNGLKPITIRIFRKEVHIPDKNDIIEHELDNFTTDFLLTTDPDLTHLLTIFPQYSDYKYCYSV